MVLLHRVDSQSAANPSDPAGVSQSRFWSKHSRPKSATRKILSVLVVFARGDIDGATVRRNKD